MCGPSSAMKQINSSIQAFSNKVVDEAGTIFGDANSVFNDIKNAMSSIVKGGPSQAGFSQAELNARNASAVQAGGAEARNLKGAAAAATGAIGGGNIVTPAGSTQQMVMSADQRAAADTAAELNKIQTENFETGRSNFFNAAKSEMEAPNVFSTANSANQNAESSLKQAQESQKAMDAQSNWWQPLLEKGVMGAVGAFTGGLGGTLGKTVAGKIMPGGGGSSGAGWSAGDIGAAEDDQLNMQS